MAKKYKKSDLKIHPLVFVAIIVLIAGIITGICLNIPSEQQGIYNDYNKSATTLGATDLTLTADNKLHKVSINEAINKIKSGETVVLYIGALWDSASISAVGTYDSQFVKSVDLTNDKGEKLSDYVSNILYVQINDQPNEEEDYDPVKDVINKLIAEFPDLKFNKEADKITPQLITFADGKLIDKVSNMNGTALSTKVRELFKLTLNAHKA